MRMLTATVLCLILIATGCASAPVPPTSTPPLATTPPTTTTQPSATASTGPTASISPQLLPQPLTPEGLDLAPDSARVDLYMPTFSNPSHIDNPLFPVSSQESVLLLGTVAGKAFRTEVTLLADHRIISWAGLQIEAVVSQYNAFLGGRIEEIAYDYYAQDDAGNVWYLGEDVFDFVDGNIVSTQGTWLAGRDGPGAMIMPANPQVGDVYRTENTPPLVFEEVTVEQTNVTLDGPLGPVAGAIVGHELHLDGATEDKQFAPAYGEFYTNDAGDIEALALAVPTDFLGTPVPANVAALTDGALAVIDHVRASDWAAAAASLDSLKTAWSSIPQSETPTYLRDVMDGWIGDLELAVNGQDSYAAQRSAIETARSGFDLQLRHRPAIEVELARMDLMAAEMQADADAGVRADVNADQFAIDYLRDRLQHRISDADLGTIDGLIDELNTAASDGDLELAAQVAGSMRDALAAMRG